MQYSLSIFLTLITLGQCVPIEIIYTGDSCDCPTKLDYAVNIPKNVKQRKYSRNDYGYKIDVPVQAKAKVSYTFDFIVEEPKTPKPSPNTKWNLFAKVDRIAVNKPDCESVRSQPCKCGERQNPGYRYVYKRVTSCPCQSENCKCNSKPILNPNSYEGSKLIYAPPDIDDQSGSRQKRDLYRHFFRPRKATSERSGRFIKLYRKNISNKEAAASNIFDFGGIIEPTDNKISSKRTLKKAYFPRLVKRDIKGEYDLLEKDREELDLTLPEIIQFMPETLQPTFKKGLCLFDGECFKTAKLLRRTKDSYEKKTQDLNNVEKQNTIENNDKKYMKNIQKVILNPSTFKKRNAGNFAYGISVNQPNSESGIDDSVLTNVPSFTNSAKSAYQVNGLPSIDIGTVWKGPTTYRKAYTATSEAKTEAVAEKLPQTLQPSPYVLDRIADTANTDRLKLNSDANESVRPPPLRYVSDISDSANDFNVIMAAENPLLREPYAHSVHHISNAELDRIVSDIIFRHPDFIDATYHFGGALVDPEPLQEQQVRNFLKKLMDGRLSLWFKEEESHAPLYYISSYDTPSRSSPYRSNA